MSLPLKDLLTVFFPGKLDLIVKELCILHAYIIYIIHKKKALIDSNGQISVTFELKADDFSCLKVPTHVL